MGLPDRVAAAAAAGLEGVRDRGRHHPRPDLAHAGAVSDRRAGPAAQGLPHDHSPTPPSASSARCSRTRPRACCPATRASTRTSPTPRSRAISPTRPRSSRPARRRRHASALGPAPRRACTCSSRPGTAEVTEPRRRARRAQPLPDRRPARRAAVADRDRRGQRRAVVRARSRRSCGRCRARSPIRSGSTRTGGSPTATTSRASRASCSPRRPARSSGTRRSTRRAGRRVTALERDGPRRARAAPRARRRRSSRSERCSRARRRRSRRCTARRTSCSAGRRRSTPRVRALRGYPIVVNAWASWCTACQAEFPAARAPRSSYGSPGRVPRRRLRRLRATGGCSCPSTSLSYPSYQADPGASTAFPARWLSTLADDVLHQPGRQGRQHPHRRVRLAGVARRRHRAVRPRRLILRSGSTAPGRPRPSALTAGARSRSRRRPRSRRAAPVGGSRRPQRAPITPPSDRAGGDQPGGRPRDVRGEHEDHAGDEVHEPGEDDLERVDPLQLLVERERRGSRAA